MRQDPNNYWEQLERLEKLIRASELKAGIIFSFHSLILGLFIDRIEPLLQMNRIYITDGDGLRICLCKKAFKVHTDAVTARADESHGNSLAGRDRTVSA